MNDNTIAWIISIVLLTIFSSAIIHSMNEQNLALSEELNQVRMERIKLRAELHETTMRLAEFGNIEKKEN
jgi:hypothetical protein